MPMNDLRSSLNNNVTKNLQKNKSTTREDSPTVHVYRFIVCVMYGAGLANGFFAKRFTK
jgi:hypothetical protein